MPADVAKTNLLYCFNNKEALQLAEWQALMDQKVQVQALCGRTLVDEPLRGLVILILEGCARLLKPERRSGRQEEIGEQLAQPWPEWRRQVVGHVLYQLEASTGNGPGHGAATGWA